MNNFAAWNNLTQRHTININISINGCHWNQRVFWKFKVNFGGDISSSLSYLWRDKYYRRPEGDKSLTTSKTQTLRKTPGHSITSVSIMFCDNAERKLILPMVVYKSKHPYDHWAEGGPTGTIFKNSTSSWLDMNLYEVWFVKLFPPHTQEHRVGNKRALLISANLNSHFPTEVVKTVVVNNIYFTTQTPNSTHIMQPVDVGVYGLLKGQLRTNLDNWITESGTRGIISKASFSHIAKELDGRIGS